ncbi:MAG TPA: GNAT family N-acetyltransferase [Polyangiaceae bacterium]
MTTAAVPTVRLATRADVAAILALLADDENASHPERGAPPADLAPYLEAFDAIAADAHQDLYVAELDGRVVGTFQLMVLRHLTWAGGRVAQVESVHVHSSERRRGIGEAMMRFAMDEGRRRGCHRLQLTSNRRRWDAHRFYERLGFTPSHVGFKIALGALALAILAACGSSGGGLHGPSLPPEDAGAGDDGGTPALDASLDASLDGSPDAPSPASDGAPPLDGGDTGPFPLGATFGPSAVHFRVRADAATAVELDLYAASLGAADVAHVAMTRPAAGQPWAADVPLAALASLGIAGPVLYGYRAWGPNWPVDPAWTEGSSAGFVSDVDDSGNRFDPNKLLIDPYAREITHDPLQPSALSSAPYDTGATSRAVDDGPLAPKSIALPADTTPTGAHPAGLRKDDVVYEVHVRGLTMNDASVPAAIRGTYAGAAAKAPALAALGVTAVELLPVHETQNDQNDANPSGANYWGYSTLAYFAPDRRYASDQTAGGPTREFKAMVAAFHAAGLKVFLDVVYNHTAEGGVSTKTAGVAELLSFRGLDNASYYELAANHQSPVDYTGTGGDFNVASPVVRDLVLDSLSYWSGTMGVDGFRFDLAAVLGNSCASVCYTWAPTDPAGILERAATELPGVALIAEPWGVGNGTYQLGSFPAGWSEWNGDFRDSIRVGQNEIGTDDEPPSKLVAKVSGSPDLFDHDGRAPWASIDYVDCHDGFTLHDEYAYDAPDDTQAYPYGPSTGGSTTNDSWDQGGAAAAQQQAARTGLAVVALSAGVPMIQGGDEMLRSQAGNNNAYNLDDSAMWLDPTLATTNAPFVAWTRGLFAFRAAHPALRPAAFWDGKDHDGNGLPDVAWLDTTGAAASTAYLASTSNHFLAWRVDGGDGGDSVRSIYVAWNGWTSAISATIPAAATGKAWYVAGDGAAGTMATPGQEPALGAATRSVAARSVLLLVER